MNYEEECKNLNQKQATWKPSMGVHQVEILEEPIKTKYVDEQDGSETPQIKLKVLVEQEELDWFVGVGKTTQSVYGQLMYLGKADNSLKGKSFSLVVNKTSGSDGNPRRTYSIPEALEVIQLETKPKVEKVA